MHSWITAAARAHTENSIFLTNFIVIAFPRAQKKIRPSHSKEFIEQRRTVVVGELALRCVCVHSLLEAFYIRRSCLRRLENKNLANHQEGKQWSMGWEKCRFSGAD
jgi:hypothetical protein